MYFVSFCFRSELGFLNCDDICMCVVNKQFELLEFLIPFNSGIVYNAADVIWMSVVRGMIGVGGVCEMYMCSARGDVRGEGGVSR